MNIGMKAFYSDLRIKYKLIILISIIMFIIGAVTYSMQQYTFEAYDNEIYLQSASALNNASLGIENELRRLEKLSFNIATDASIQSYLTIIKQGGSDYDNFLTAAKLRERMFFLGGLEKYVLSLQIIDAYGKEYTNGNNAITSTLGRIEQIRTETAKNTGGIRFIVPDHYDSALIAGREIRKVPNLELSYLGNISIRIDVNKLFQDFAGGMGRNGARFTILEGNQLVYSLHDSLGIEKLGMNLSGKRGYQILPIGGKKHFITYVPSEYTNWTYLNIIPFNEIFKETESAKRTVFIIYGMIYLVVILFSLAFARRITGPIERLNSKMRRVQLGNFEYVEEPGDREISKDEAGQMQRNFRIMVQRIEELIRENYVKQIAIKDTEFKALQAQINPHFLYNTLEAINWSAKAAGQRQISLMVESLGYLLRSSISNKEALITLEEELTIIRNYITIQKIRFEERLDFVQVIPPELSRCLIPKFSLQPLVENAVNYGLEQMIETCRIRIEAKQKEGCLFITVSDNGPGMDQEFLEKQRAGQTESKGTGIGLRNIDERIKLLFNDNYGIEIKSERGSGTQVTLRLPVEMRDSDV
ncbi:sensor histidine kinase [Paenibacillus abyssi]|uniref:histidine kinase n=1 Tax=Paenibacillus abyssi TaxID=1340531 RepID=A0A917FTE2_9BACL|nr:sensor histidine kinase [Paenibacillus abyssi]GGF99923.1 sensor histidine kinase YesM [Paenibacillus abyssi]